MCVDVGSSFNNKESLSKCVERSRLLPSKNERQSDINDIAVFNDFGFKRMTYNSYEVRWYRYKYR